MIHRNLISSAALMAALAVLSVLMLNMPAAKLHTMYTPVLPSSIEFTYPGQTEEPAAEFNIYDLINTMKDSPYTADLNITIHSETTEQGTDEEGNLTEITTEITTNKILSIITDGVNEHTVGQSTSSYTPDKVTNIETYSIREADGSYTLYDSVGYGDHVQWEKSSGISAGADLFNTNNYIALSRDEGNDSDNLSAYSGEFNGTVDSNYFDGTVTILADQDKNWISKIMVISPDGKSTLSAEISENNTGSITVPQSVIDAVVNNIDDIPVDSGATTYVTAANLNFRDMPSLEGNIMEEVPVGTYVSGSPYDGEWAEISHNGQTGYMNLEFLVSPSDRVPYYTTRDVNLRKEMTLESEILNIIPGRTPIYGLGGDDTWQRVNYDHQTGYVAFDCMEPREDPNAQPQEDNNENSENVSESEENSAENGAEENIESNTEDNTESNEEESDQDNASDEEEIIDIP